jgi:hypothetical protein
LILYFIGLNVATWLIGFAIATGNHIEAAASRKAGRMLAKTFGPVR